MIKGVLFDMDGLLVDSEPFWREGEIRVFSKFGINLTEDDCRSTTGLRVDMVVDHWQQRFPDIVLNKTEVVLAINTEVTRLILDNADALPGVYDTIGFFSEHNIPMALASSSGNLIIEAVVKKLNLNKHLAFWQSAEFLKYGKPHPEVFLVAAEKLKMAPEHILVFEDSVYGVIAARAARMNVIAVPEEANFSRPEFVIANAKLKSLNAFTPELFRSLFC